MTADVRRSVRRRSWLWAAGSAVGAALVALPDDDARVFSLSEGHGPSAVDLAGVVVVLATWLPVPALLLSRRSPLRGRAGWAALLAVVAGMAALAWAVATDTGGLWVLPAVLLVGVQVAGLWLTWARAPVSGAGTPSRSRRAASA